MKEALKLELEALKYAASMGHGGIVREMKVTPFTIKEALAQPEQEPCGGCGGSGWVPRDPDIGTDQECFDCNGSGAQPEQEPVAWDVHVHTEHCFQGEYQHCCKYGDGDDCTAKPTKGALAPTSTQCEVPPEQEPVACDCRLQADECNGDTATFHPFQVGASCSTRLCERVYTTPPQRPWGKPWVSLTDEEISQLWISTSPYFNEDDFARNIEAKLKEKNT